MTVTIGLRFYRITVVERRTTNLVNFSTIDPYPFIERFLTANTTFTDNEEAQRSWLLTPRDGADLREFWGTIRYGTFGYASRLVDRKTRKPQYQRRPTDLEEIELFFHFWMPEGESFGLAAFQSFQARSCVVLVTNAISEAFKARHPNHFLRFEKVSPNYLGTSVLGMQPVKRVTLVSKTQRSDAFDTLLSGEALPEYNYEISISAKRNHNLGILADWSRRIDHDDKGLLVHGEATFEKAVAEIEVNGKRKRVGVAGMDSDTGTIDVTDKVQLVDGHPTFDSISAESNDIMAGLFERMTG